MGGAMESEVVGEEGRWGRTKEGGDQERNGPMGRAVWSCGHKKPLLATIFFLFLSLVAVVVLFSPSFPCFSTANLRSCLATVSWSTNISRPLNRGHKPISASLVTRDFKPVGSAAYVFVKMGAYRGGPGTFAVVGLASKPLYAYGKPDFQCEWLPSITTSNNSIGNSFTTPGSRILADGSFGRMYTVLVVNCTFETDVGSDGSGGRLILHASLGGPGDVALVVDEKITAMEEAPGTVSAATFTAPPKYDYVYCGSPLFGDPNPQWIREWMAYHAKLFSESTDKFHFVLHDAGGVHPGVMEALKPWLETGILTVENIREQERFDGYYHNQFLVLNDCLHRYRLMAKWIFFFDVDEFIWVEPESSLRQLVDSVAAAGYTQFRMRQLRMSSKLCRTADANNTARMWGIEKLVYKIDPKAGEERKAYKYAIQPRNAFATGVHASWNIVGKRADLNDMKGRIKFFHYHGAIGVPGDPCREFTEATNLTSEGIPYVLDETLRNVSSSVKEFELMTIAS